MACHQSGITGDIVGIDASDSGRSCHVHKCCDSVIAPDVVVCFQAVQLLQDNGEKVVALAAHHMTGGVDGCHLGFLQRHLLRCKDECNGRLAQVADVFDEKSESPSDQEKHHRNKGCCRATLIKAVRRTCDSSCSMSVAYGRS